MSHKTPPLVDESETYQEILCAWIETDINLDDIDISEFLKKYGVLDKDAMQKQIKEEIMQCHKKNSQWQRIAMLDSFPTD